MFLVLSAVVFSTIGVMIGLVVMNEPFGIIMTGVGTIALAGTIVSNNIVLIDTFNFLRSQAPDAPIRDLLLLTGAQRLRPVFLTSINNILGLLPMAFQMNIDILAREVTMGAPSTQWWVSLATAIVFGMLFATPLTLIITPSALQLRANVEGWWQRRQAAKIAA
jgi:multidrug efflux pump